MQILFNKTRNYFICLALFGAATGHTATPDSVTGLHLLAAEAEAEKKWEKLEKILLQILSKDPAHSGSFATQERLANTQFKLRKYAESVQTLDALLDHSSPESRDHLNLLKLPSLLNLKQFQRLLLVSQEVKQISNKRKALTYESIALLELGKLAEAESCFMNSPTEIMNAPSQKDASSLGNESVSVRNLVGLSHCFETRSPKIGTEIQFFQLEETLRVCILSRITKYGKVNRFEESLAEYFYEKNFSFFNQYLKKCSLESPLKGITRIGKREILEKIKPHCQSTSRIWFDALNLSGENGTWKKRFDTALSQWEKK